MFSDTPKLTLFSFFFKIVPKASDFRGVIMLAMKKPLYISDDEANAIRQ